MGTDRLWMYKTAAELAKETFDYEAVIGVKVPISKKPDMAKIEPLMKKSNKPAELFATCDIKKLTLDVRVGSAYKQVVGEIDFEKEKDIEKRRELMRKVMNKDPKLLSGMELGKWENLHPTPDQKDFAKRRIAETKPEVEKLKAKLNALKSLTYDHCGSEELKKEFREWVEKKGWGHYLEFVRDVDEGNDSQKIYDTYIGDGKQQVAKPVNLDAAMAGKIRQALAANQVPDFTPARTLIVKMVDIRFVGDFRKEALPKLTEELKYKEKWLADDNETLSLK
jgi:hypothetical protein